MDEVDESATGSLTFYRPRQRARSFREPASDVSGLRCRCGEGVPRSVAASVAAQGLLRTAAARARRARSSRPSRRSATRRRPTAGSTPARRSARAPRRAARRARRRGRRRRRRRARAPAAAFRRAGRARRGGPAGSSKSDERHPEERAHRRAQRLRAGRVGAAGRERDAGAERVSRAEQRADVPGIRDVPERERHRPHAARQVVAPVDADHARRVRERRHLGEERRLDVLARDEQVDRLDARRRLDEILTLRDEQPELVAPAPVVELADELEPLVVAGGDQAGVDQRVRPWPARRSRRTRPDRSRRDPRGPCGRARCRPCRSRG